MAVNRFNNNMFQFEDFDMSGIMNPELVDVMNMRKEANLARGNATDQYEVSAGKYNTYGGLTHPTKFMYMRQLNLSNTGF